MQILVIAVIDLSLVFIKGFVINTPGYPEAVVVQCSAPAGYPDTWDYKIWMKGIWALTENVTNCIDPNLCYDSPPSLPLDFTVNWNQTTAKPNTVNTTLNYTCGRKCEYIFFTRCIF